MFFPQFLHSECDHHEITHGIMHEIGSLSRDLIQLNINLFSRDSARILTASIPWFVATSFADTSIQSNFYDDTCHKNKNQFHNGFTEFIETSAFISVIGVSSLALFVKDPELRMVSRIFALGAFSGLAVKDIVKLFPFKAGLRPPNERFDCTQKYYTGFPSGHMFQATYLATVLGFHYGPKVLYPLIAFNAAMFSVLVASNRHYVSQVIAGAAFGLMYGAAAHSLIDRRLNEKYGWGLSYDNGFLACKLEVSF